MRTNLTKMLDHIGLNKWLGIDTSLLLFSKNRSIAHHTSILRYPVFRNKQNYSGQPAIDRVAFLREQVDRWFAAELKLLSNSVFIPLGAQVQGVFTRLAQDQGISENSCLIGIPHPSGANAERIAYFLGRSPRAISRGKRMAKPSIWFESSWCLRCKFSRTDTGATPLPLPLIARQRAPSLPSPSPPACACASPCSSPA